MKISPARRVKGTIGLPGDKSISHRAALIAALANGKSRIASFSTSQDCASTLACLRQLGVSIEREGNDVALEGRGHLSAPPDVSLASLDCDNSGSTMRMLAGILAGQNFATTLTGDDSLQTRPMKRIIEPLELMGARIASDHGRPPLRIEGATLNAINYELTVASAQVKTCVLFAGLLADGRTEVVEGIGATRDHTERMLQWFGAPIEITEDQDSQTRTCAIVGPAAFAGRDVRVPGDFSSAAFFIAAAALLPGSELEITGVGLNRTRTQFLETLRSLGAKVEIREAKIDCNEPAGTIVIQGTDGLGSATVGPSQTSALSIDGQLTAALIDELPLLAVVGTQLPGGLVIRDARELRYKETDRIAATVRNLRAMNAEVVEYDDGLAVAGTVRLKGAQLDACGDHRIAMAFSVAALVAEGDSQINGSECVAISFPEFYERLESVVER
jgi:3-phosphoshikimate 1-carboxyvinyltransferase